ncbi:MAG: tetraacyldisaccharide 4'-kinase [Planctomycetota bacterium]|jgi:tetraacyldisaccharide 4'-kinase
MDQAKYKKLVSGQTKGLLAAALRLMLWVLSLVYAIVICLRNLLYWVGLLPSYDVGAAVISVGNITAGGTGKTPLVIWLAKQISEDHKCAILSRGYKASGEDIDEPAVISQACPQVVVIVNPDRVAGAAEAVRKLGSEVLIADDGFQHRRLARDIDIVTIDATCPFGYGKMLPAGLLREPISSLRRADAVVLTRCDLVDTAEIEQRIRIIKTDMIIARSIHAAVGVKSLDDQLIELDQLKGKKIFAFCGIGNPDAFLRTIENLNLNMVGSKIFDDHHHYTQSCLDDICREGKNVSADLMLTTKKDQTKLVAGFTSAIEVGYLEIEIKFLAGEDKLKGLIENSLAGKIHGK